MGQAKSYLLGNGFTTTKNYQYGYLLKHEAKLGNTTLHNLEYTYNYANGNMVSRKDNFPIMPQTEVFTYDNLDRLTSSQVSVPNFTFDAVNYNYDGGNNYSKGNLTHNSIVGNFTYDGSKYHQLGFAQGIVNMPPGQVYMGPTIIPNTDVISDLQQQITYTPFQKTDKIIEDSREIRFSYDANYDRIKSVFTDLNTNETTTKYYLGDFETRTNPQGETYRIHYIKGGDGLCAMLTMDDNAGTEIHYVYTDHLGSICKVTDANGNMEAWQSFDAWGRQRNPNDWAQIYPSLQANNNVPEWLYRGYTGHEHLSEFALINMNGRMYDPALGRMCSPDKYIADPYSTQAYNRYTYANNNPLKYTDPSGDVINLVAGAIGAGVGGLINLGVMAYKGKVTSVGAGFAAFGIGALAGFVGGITCGASLAATGLTTGVMAGTVGGAVSGAVSAPILTLGNGIVFNDFDPNKSIGRQLVESSLIGGISGAVIGGTIGFIQAKWFIPKPRVNVELDEIRPGRYEMGPEYNLGPDGVGPNVKIKFDGNAALKAINQNRSINAHVNITNEEAMQNIVKYAEMTGKDYQLQNIIKDNGMRMTRLTIDNTIYQFRSF